MHNEEAVREGMRRYGVLKNDAKEYRTCDSCGRQYATVAGMKECPSCGGESTHADDRNPVKNEGNKPEGHIEKCPDCGAEFGTDAAVEAHMKSKHGRENGGGCTTCGHGFYSHASTYSSDKMKCRVEGCNCEAFTI